MIYQNKFCAHLGVQVVTILVMVSFTFAGTNLSGKFQNKRKIVVQKTVKEPQAKKCAVKPASKKAPKTVNRPPRKAKPKMPKKTTGKKGINRTKQADQKKTDKSSKKNQKVTNLPKKTDRKIVDKRKGNTPKINKQQKRTNRKKINQGRKNNPRIVISEKKNGRRVTIQEKRNNRKINNQEKRDNRKITKLTEKTVRITTSDKKKNTKRGRRGHATVDMPNIKKKMASVNTKKDIRKGRRFGSRLRKPVRILTTDKSRKKEITKGKSTKKIASVKNMQVSASSEIPIRIIKDMRTATAPHLDPDKVSQTQPIYRQEQRNRKANLE